MNKNTEENKGKKKRSKVIDVILILGIVICLAIAGVAGYICFNKLANDHQSIKEYNEIKDKVVVPRVDNKDKDVPIEEQDTSPIEIDWDYLLSINPEIAGWLYIPCLDVSYPIMHTDNNDYYLHRTYEHTWVYAGSIFLDTNNTPDFSDPNSIIYGHNMANGSMFGNLWHITWQDAAADDPYFWILTPEKDYKYHIFSSFETDSMSSVYAIFNSRGDGFLEWCNNIKSYSVIDVGEETFQLTDNIVTLSTCSGTGDTGRRTVVFGKCINGPIESKTPVSAGTDIQPKTEETAETEYVYEITTTTAAAD